jgi:hypothetical protein
MTAHQFIDDIFSRPQRNVAGNMRYVTERQFNWLKDLIGQDEEGAAVKNGINGGLVWLPSGRWKYVLSYDPGSGRRALTKLASPMPSSAGSLFG